MMGLEGNLRELALQEVLQLLTVTRKSGELCLVAPLAGLTARIGFDSGAVVSAKIDGRLGDEQTTLLTGRPDLAELVSSTVMELLGWTDGSFRFVPRPPGTERVATGVRLNTDVLLMEGARRVEVWSRLADRVPNARVVPAFFDVEARQLPLLNLQPSQWEVLTGVDGQRDILALSRSIGRDLLETAETVYGLLEMGLLCVHQTQPAARTHQTPPSSASHARPAPLDVWVPSGNEPDTFDDYEHDDEIFDPVRVGVVTPDGLPRLRTPAATRVVLATQQRLLGDEAARRGDLAEALAHWSAVVDADRGGPDAEHAREAMALAARLSELLGVPV